MNKLVRNVGLSALNMLGINRVLLRAKRSWPLALGYHGVTSNVGSQFIEDKHVTSEAFDRQLAWLKRHCDVVDLPDYLEVVRRSRKRKRRVVTITFDDGYENNLTCAVPVLEAHGMSACFFLTAGPIRDGCWLDHDLLPISVRFSRKTWEARVRDKTWLIAHDATAAKRQMIGREVKQAMSYLPWKEYVELVHEFYRRTGRPEPPDEYAQF
ncbi:MAG: polysaccharide deacetylase family protein, partial [bacterium]